MKVKHILREADLGEIKIFKRFKDAGVNTKTRVIKGWASTSDKDRVDDVVTPQALKGASGDLTKKGASTVFYNHDTSIAIGKVLTSNYKTKGVDGAGIFVSVQISKASDVEDYWTKIKEGVLNSFSIRLRPKKVEVVRDEETGRITEYRILKMNLLEVSVVGIPCNEECSIEEVLEKSFNERTRRINMKVKKTSKKSATGSSLMADVAREVVGTELAPINSALAEIQKGLATLMKAGTQEVEEPKSKKTAKTVEAETEEQPDLNAQILAELKKLNSSTGRRGAKDADDDDAEGIVEDDEDCDDDCKNTAENAEYLKKAINTLGSPARYSKLSEGEKEQAKNAYMAALLVQTTNGN